jgi:hypothetical protein
MPRSSKQKMAPQADALLAPFPPHLTQMPENQLLFGAGLALEASRFLAHRLEAYASYFDKLTKCASMGEIAALQTTFWTDLQRDYANEGAAVAAVSTLTGLPSFARDTAPLPWRMNAQEEKPAEGVH